MNELCMLFAELDWTVFGVLAFVLLVIIMIVAFFCLIKKIMDDI